MIALPRSGRGRRSAAQEVEYQDQLRAFCAGIKEIRSSLDFDVSARGWCYILEEKGLGKGDFDKAATLITDCRKKGLLPLDIVAEDGARAFDNLEIAGAEVNDQTIEEMVEEELEEIEEARERAIRQAGLGYAPYDFWHGQPFYIEMMVEKIDLKNLFAGICREFHIPLVNARGWTDLNSRAAMARRFAGMEAEGTQCVLLYCGDHDPVGLAISDFLDSNLAELAPATGWRPDDLIIDRFGLNADFIETHRLSWIEGLETGSGRNLADPRHPDHGKDHVQKYLRQFGARKVEANALVTRPEAGRALCRAAIGKYLPADAPEVYRRAIGDAQQTIRESVLARLGARQTGADP